MEDTNKHETWSTLMAKIGTNYTERLQKAQNEYLTHARKAAEVQKGFQPVVPANTWQAWTEYATDFTQRSVLFWDTLRERGNTYREHIKAGTPRFWPSSGR